MAGEKKKKKWWIAAIVIVVIIIAAAGGNSGDSDKSGTDSNPKKVSQTDDKKKDSNDENKGDADSKNDKQEESVQTEFVKGDVVETKSLKVSFLECGEFTDYSEYSEPAKGNKIIYATFEFENISDDNEYISTSDFSCYADGYDCESYYDFDQESLDATLSKGRKTKGKVLFEVPKDAKEIKIEYDINFITSDKIIFVYQ
ncbi:DUF4352 domain-containing protein [uncultured Eubacterium sp.]|uniref:DUF4352 domain-containing protein n=1 Tax=uncultured Eubacterium sp. TaxID=165185 RepID=UPI003266FDB4